MYTATNLRDSCSKKELKTAHCWISVQEGMFSHYTTIEQNSDGFSKTQMCLYSAYSTYFFTTQKDIR